MESIHAGLQIMLDRGELLKALRAFKRGDFSVRMPLNMTGVDGEIAQAFNDVVELEDNRGKPLHETLSDREYQVMWMIASGKTVRQIADELFLSPNTVSTHRTRILRKMNMKSNAELMHYAIAHHLVD